MSDCGSSCGGRGCVRKFGEGEQLLDGVSQSLIAHPPLVTGCINGAFRTQLRGWGWREPRITGQTGRGVPSSGVWFALTSIVGARHMVQSSRAWRQLARLSGSLKRRPDTGKDTDDCLPWWPSGIPRLLTSAFAFPVPDYRSPHKTYPGTDRPISSKQPCRPPGYTFLPMRTSLVLLQAGCHTWQVFGNLSYTSNIRIQTRRSRGLS